MATVVISVITNWVDVYDTIDTWIIPCNSTVINTVATWPLSDSRYTKGKYIGKDGTVIELTEIKFNYKDAPQIHRIETELYCIKLRCKELPPAPPELIWDEPIIYTNASLNSYFTNALLVIDSNVIPSTTNSP